MRGVQILSIGCLLALVLAMFTVPPANVAHAQFQQAPITICNQHTYLQMTTATTTQLVAGILGQNIRVCAYGIQGYIAGSKTTMQFVSGTTTTTPCDTGAMLLTAPWAFTTSTSSPISFGSGLGQLFITASGANLCAVNSATGTIEIDVSYTIF
jgi:hypothetical protein